MSRWTTIFASIAIIAFCLPAVAADSDPPRNIELKPGAASPDAAGQTAADTSSGTTTRQIVTEGKDAPAAEAAPAAPAPAPTEAALPPAKAETSPPPDTGTGSGTSTASRRGCGSCPAATAATAASRAQA